MKKSKKVLLIVLSVVLLIVIACIIFISQTQKNLDALNGIIIEEVDLNKIPDGVFKGSYSAFPVSVIVEVTVKDHVITKIDLVEHINGQGGAAEIIPEEVVAAQSLSVDAATGATYSSKVILLAIQDALKSAAEE